MHFRTECKKPSSGPSPKKPYCSLGSQLAMNPSLVQDLRIVRKHNSSMESCLTSVVIILFCSSSDLSLLTLHSHGFFFLLMDFCCCCWHALNFRKFFVFILDPILWLCHIYPLEPVPLRNHIRGRYKVFSYIKVF